MLCYTMCVVWLWEVIMIKPLQAIASYSMMSNPYAKNSQAIQGVYQSASNYSQKGEKLNINCADMRSVTRHGQKLDLYA